MRVVQATFGVFHSFELAQQMAARGHLVKIYSTWPWARLKREGLPRELVATFPFVGTADYLLGRTSFYPDWLRLVLKEWHSTTLDAYLRRVVPECDALVALSGAGLTAGPVVQRRGGKFVCDRGSTHHRFQEETLRDEYKRWGLPHEDEAAGVIERDEAIYAMADAITVPSSVAARSFVTMGVPAEKMRVIPYGVRLERFRKTGDAPKETFEVLFAGQVSVRKGIPYLLEAFKRLQHPGKRLTVVGAVQEHMVGLLKTLPTEGVTFLGAVPQAELIDRMSRSHVLVLASVEEGLALVQAQALACECPIIATEATGAEDLFTNGVEGFIVKDRDVDALAARLQEVAEDRVLRERMAGSALERVKGIGGWEAYGARWDVMLHELTGVAKDETEA